MELKLSPKNIVNQLDVFGLFDRDELGNFTILKRTLISAVGAATYWRYAVINKMHIEGTEYLQDLPEHNVLFLSNHQTYFADVIAFYHIFSSVKWGFKDHIKVPIYLLSPRVKSYYVAANETMNKGIIPKLLSLAGAVTVERSWRANGKEVKRDVDTSGQDRIGKALQEGWVVSFPQGTTSPYAPIRKGTAHMIKEFNPIVVPVVINGFRRAFDKKGLIFRKTNTQLSVRFKEPVQFDPSLSVEDIVEHIRQLIEQEVPVEKMKWMK
ncbi:lysophospholipid acyltransferase family protein [Cytophagaceae bacterium DM2B3-1]|uniref:Lysophospholipid acyltransferase family protein n=1 Tax=Xanthocytophaga flava TaxID=3048013 RepID=A0ABT7CKC5_9BACT|nr:lysophospholipid acyltransferase family protein [Xanthocytophaga flavus]MDJ1469335.1 lysophospholipid acyltransferase family protein [Xanthocytophaga flavus]MDJ1494205.1 lysophospholipid acyltransferase family protein [Xanthocytophaga flavus]